MGEAMSDYYRLETVPREALQAAIASEKNVVAERDAAYSERNTLVALLTTLFPAGIRRTEIPGWQPEWHNCVYVDLPNGQAAWHYHDREAHLFQHLPPYTREWDGHTTEQKYQRIMELVRKGIIV